MKRHHLPEHGFIKPERMYSESMNLIILCPGDIERNVVTESHTFFWL